MKAVIETDLKNGKIRISELLENSDAVKIIETEFPGLTKNPLIKLYSGAELDTIIKKFGNKVSAEKFERLKNKLENA